MRSSISAFQSVLALALAAIAMVAAFAPSSFRPLLVSNCKAVDGLKMYQYLYDARTRWSSSSGRKQGGNARQRAPPPSRLYSFSNPVENALTMASSVLSSVLGENTPTSEGTPDSQTTLAERAAKKNAIGKVVRTAARAFREDGGSRPGSRLYTTRKDSLPSIIVDRSGVSGDYNDYRTRVLKGTNDRAISILTSDVMSEVRAEKRNGADFGEMEDGDLGENVLLDGLPYTFFEIGQRYRFYPAKDGHDADATTEAEVYEGVIIEITEPAIPCANLCNLPYINKADLEPRQRVERCHLFLDRLSIAEGIRGWYGKVIVGGTIRPGDAVAALVGN